MKTFVILTDGIGNRFNHIYNFLREIENVTFVWRRTTGWGRCLCRWDELFKYPKLDIIYSEIAPKTGKVIEFNHKDPNNLWAYYQYYDNIQHNKLVKEFIDNLVPTEEVASLLYDLPKGTIGHSIRACHPNSRIGRKPMIKISDGDFLASDSAWVRELNPKALQTAGTKGAPYNFPIKRTADLHLALRNRQGIVAAVADWLMLFRCDTIYEYGLLPTPFQTLEHSTFLDSHKIYGKQIINMTHKYDVGKEPWGI